MRTDEAEDFRQRLWKGQEENVPVNMDEVRAKARKRETIEVSAYWTILVFAILFAAVFLRNLIVLRDPWLLAGTGWALAALCFISWRLLRNGPNRKRQAEPCLQFLRRALEAKRGGLLSIRWLALLMIPSVAAGWLGNGLALHAEALGVGSPAVLRFLQGPLPPIAILAASAFIWFAFTRQARKVAVEIERLRAQER